MERSTRCLFSGAFLVVRQGILEAAQLEQGAFLSHLTCITGQVSLRLRRVPGSYLPCFARVAPAKCEYTSQSGKASRHTDFLTLDFANGLFHPLHPPTWPSSFTRNLLTGVWLQVREAASTIIYKETKSSEGNRWFVEKPGITEPAEPESGRK